MTRTSGSILAIDDEPAILRFLQTHLQMANYTVYTARCGADGLNLVQETMLDLILLDLGLPDMDGLELLVRLRRHSRAPIIIISARDDEQSVVTGLTQGADDYLVKPFSGRALQARIEAVLRRYRSTPPVAERTSYQHGPLCVDVASRTVTMNGSAISLTPIEFELLVELIREPGRVRLHSDLLTTIWGPEYRDDVTVLRASIYRLRHKIEPDPSKPILIITESGIGYSFARPETASSPVSSAPEPSEPLTPSPITPHYALAEGAM
jgi:two-component system KDP operon response regulator KdpE